MFERDTIAPGAEGSEGTRVGIIRDLRSTPEVLLRVFDKCMIENVRIRPGIIGFVIKLRYLGIQIGNVCTIQVTD